MPKTKKRPTVRKHVLLSHHSHTGKHLAHEHTSYTLLMGLVMYVGIVMIMMTRSAAAIDYSVNASVKGITPTDAAVIITPTNGEVFSSTPKVVSGTCPLDTYVKIYRNNVFGGSAVCTVDKNFSLSTDLFVGENELIARVFNTTDDEGPQSAPVTVRYTPPVPLPTLISGNTPITNTNRDESTGYPSPKEPFLITADVKYVGHYIKQLVEWEFEIIGGTTPYIVTIDWGDGTIDTLSRHLAGKFVTSHTYQQAGGYKGSFLVKTKAVDATGRSSYLELFAIINDILQPSLGSGTTSSSSKFSGGLQGYLWIIWPLYLLLLLRIMSLWLAERHHPRLQKKHTGPRHLKPHHS